MIYVGDGSSRWPACHQDGVAVLIGLVLEKGKPGSTFHTTAEQGVSMRETFSMMAKIMKLPSSYLLHLGTPRKQEDIRPNGHSCKFHYHLSKDLKTQTVYWPSVRHLS